MGVAVSMIGVAMVGTSVAGSVFIAVGISASVGGAAVSTGADLHPVKLNRIASENTSRKRLCRFIVILLFA
jgi:hypothetical protein